MLGVELFGMKLRDRVKLIFSIISPRLLAVWELVQSHAVLISARQQ